MNDDATIHASAVRVGETGILIRGPSGSGKSRLAFDLILAGRAGQIAPCTLIGDDRVCLSRAGDRLMVFATPELAGLIEIRGLGIRRCAFAPEAAVHLVVDLAVADSMRMPLPEHLNVVMSGITIQRIPVAAGQIALPLVLAALLTRPFEAVDARPTSR